MWQPSFRQLYSLASDWSAVLDDVISDVESILFRHSIVDPLNLNGENNGTIKSESDGQHIFYILIFVLF